MGCGAQDSKAADEIVVNRHDSAGVVELSAVVRRRKESHKLPVRLELVAVLDDLGEVFFIFLFPASTHAREEQRRNTRDKHPQENV